MNRRTLLTSTAAVAVAGFGATLFLGRDPQVTTFGVTPANAQDAETVDTSSVPDLNLGSEDAPVHIIEYASYTCPHCANFHATTFKQLKEEFIDTGKVRFTYREVFFDKYGLWAAMVARCAGDIRYFGVQELLYSKQSDWIGQGKDAMEIVENLRTIGKQAGLTDENLDACLNDGEYAQKLVAKFEKEITEFDISATPTLVIDGEVHSNMAYADLKEIITKKLEM